MKAFSEQRSKRRHEDSSANACYAAGGGVLISMFHNGRYALLLILSAASCSSRREGSGFISFLSIRELVCRPSRIFVMTEGVRSVSRSIRQA